MLNFLGLTSLDDLFRHIPSALRVAGGLDIPSGRTEPDVGADFAKWARGNLAATSRMTCFAGAGAYDHEVPPVVRSLAARSEFVTAYTPYQPEVAQGVLQAIFEFQTLVTRLSGLEIPNASLYDGATGLVEAANLATGVTGRSKIVVSAGVHPHWRSVLATFARGTGHEVQVIPLRNGVTDWSLSDPANAAAVVVSYPNYLGVLEDVSLARRLADEHGALLVLGADPVAAGVLKTAGQWGADVFVGEGQPFGTALSFGGPYLGLFACRREHIRRLPGRIVGETRDVDGRVAYVTTLRAREQDIRREKATSNICSNQTLMAVTAAIQLGWLGTQGVREVATRSAVGAHYLYDALVRLEGVTPFASNAFFREFALRVRGGASKFIDEMSTEGILAGVAAHELAGSADVSLEQDGSDVLIVSVTERRTREEMDRYVDVATKVLA